MASQTRNDGSAGGREGDVGESLAPVGVEKVSPASGSTSSESPHPKDPLFALPAQKLILRGKDLDDPLDPDFAAKQQSEGGGHSSKTVLQKAKGFVSEGHTTFDSLLSNANATIGQVIQVYPHQVAIMGMIPALVLSITTQFLNYYTLCLLVILFLERKRKMIEEEKWYDTTDSNGYKRRRAVTQYHDLIGFSLGTFGKRLAQLCVAISLFGTGIAQIIASSSSQYTISPQINKRNWGLILGPPILLMGLLPSFRSVRIINVIALIGTNYSCLYFFIYGASKGITPGIFTRGPLSVQQFFLGAATVISGGHTYQVEMMDAMRKSRRFAYSSFFSVIWNLALLVPHSYALVLAEPKLVTKQSNIYASLPDSEWKRASIYLMYIHNMTAFTLHFNPFLYMWERMIFTHKKPWYIRIPSRIPVLLFLWLIALLIPFYGTINSLFSAISNGMTGYVLPCLAFNWYYRSQQKKDDCPTSVPKLFTIWNWTPMILLNWFLLIVFFGGDTVCGITFAVKQLVKDIDTFKIFATCYQC